MDVKTLSPISIHAPREGCDTTALEIGVDPIIFQSTHPVRGATMKACQAQMGLIFQSTHPVRGATRQALVKACWRLISIHAPREGCDQSDFAPRPSSGISIHAPREGCDNQQDQKTTKNNDFNPRTP